MNRKELNLIKELISDREYMISEHQQDIKYYQMHYDCIAKKELDEKIKEREYYIKCELEEIATLQSIYRIVKEALKNGKTN